MPHPKLIAGGRFLVSGLGACHELEPVSLFDVQANDVGLGVRIDAAEGVGERPPSTLPVSVYGMALLQIVLPARGTAEATTAATGRDVTDVAEHLRYFTSRSD